MSAVPWFRWYPSDYRRKTLHLSFAEDCAYRRLIEAYMERRGPLPAEPIALYRLCAAQDDVERGAIDRVSAEFFQNGDGRLRHNRCDEELANQEKQALMRSASATHASRIRWASGTVSGKMRDSDSDSDSKPDSSSKEKPKSKALRPPRAKKPRGEVAAPTHAVWTAYSTAYFGRYGTEPVRNAMVNGQIANFVSRIGATEAPAVAANYLRSQNPRYVRAGHSVGVMVADAEKLRTEWAKGETIGAGGSGMDWLKDEIARRENGK
jgi:uncharacterized protein YdaU (DUF1376 family)